MYKKYKINLDNYDDCGTLLYDLEHQKEVHAGGSGPATSALVTYTYIYQLLKEKKRSRIFAVSS